MKLITAAMLFCCATSAFAGSLPGSAIAEQPKLSPGAGPSIVVVETEKGTFEFETYPNEAPKTVAHILGLIEKRFYNGQRIHRQVPGFVVQFGDQQILAAVVFRTQGRLPDQLLAQAQRGAHRLGLSCGCAARR